MAIRDWPGGAFLVEFPCNPALGDELHSITRVLQDRRAGGVCHVVLDFSNVDFVDSSHLSSLLRLHRLVQQHGGRLVLCSLNSAVGRTLTKAGFDSMFEIRPNRFDALTAVQTCDQPPA